VTIVHLRNCPARAMYAQTMETLLGGQQAADMTRRSVIMHNLDTAAKDPIHTLNMVIHMFKEIERLAESQKELYVSHTVSVESEDEEEEEEEEEEDEDEDEERVGNMSFE